MLKKSNFPCRYDESASQKLKDQLAMKYGQRQEGSSAGTGNIKALSDELTTNKIAEIKKKILSNRRTRIKGETGEDADRGLAFNDMESDKTKEIRCRERQWRTRTTILQSNGKIFAKNVLAILNSVRAREEGRYGGQPRPEPGMPVRPGMQPPAPQPLPYNRYGQEHFRQADTEGFKIDTTGTYAGKTLKSVMTEGSVAKRPPIPHPQVPRPMPVAAKVMPPPAQPLQPQKPQKRVSKTPIIIIPAAPKSLITMYNVKEILQDLRFVSTEEKRAAGMKRDNDVLIQRRKEGGLTVPYRGKHGCCSEPDLGKFSLRGEKVDILPMQWAGGGEKKPGTVNKEEKKEERKQKEKER
jgi:parafibromin